MYVVSFSSFVKPFQHELKKFKDEDSVKAYMCKQMDRMCHVMRYEYWNIGQYYIDNGIEYVNKNFLDWLATTNWPYEYLFVCHTDYSIPKERISHLSELRFIKTKKDWITKNFDEYDVSDNGTLFDFKIARSDIDFE